MAYATRTVKKDSVMVDDATGDIATMPLLPLRVA